MSLLGTLTSGVSALKTYSKSLEVIGNNIANVNTTAYKGSSVNFADTFSNTLRAASTADSAIQIGTGVQVGSVNTNYTQGGFNGTGKPTDLAVSGNGYFVVQDGLTAGSARFATRDGSFHFDTAGYLRNAQNMYVLDNTGAAIQASFTDTSTTPSTAVPYSSLASVSIGTDGTVTGFTAGGASFSTQKVGLMNIPDQTKLMKTGQNLYDFSAAGTTTIGTANAAGLGKIQSGELELSNVDLTEQFSDLITSQRSFQAASRLITVSDTVLEDIVNLKR